jgi:4-hydroxy-tetrahydrodipicolinate reductase
LSRWAFFVGSEDEVVEIETTNACRVLIVGIGRMGSALQAILRDRGFRVGAMVGSQGDAAGRSLDQVLADECWDAAWEFTLPQVAPTIIAQLLRARVPTISGSTGWDIAPAVRLANENQTSFLHSANFSIGVAITRRLVAAAAQWTRPHGFEPAIVERHHRFKLDRPSGTAKLLAGALGDAATVQTVSLRQGNTPGEHSVYFEGEAESVEITHRAYSREVFAVGAAVAGEWLLRDSPNRAVTFEDFLERTWSWMSIGEESLPRL